MKELKKEKKILSNCFNGSSIMWTMIRMKNEKRVSFREESTPSTSTSNMERMMEEMMKKMSILERAKASQN